MTVDRICMLITMIAYIGLVVVVGLYYSRKNRNTDDFYLGGRKLGPVVTAMSAEASDMSSYLLMGIPGLAYFTGMSEAGWTIIGLSVGTYLNWLLVAKRLRIYTAKTEAITIPDFFKNRFKDNSNALLGISAVIILVFFVPYTASGFAACGKLFSSLFNVDYMPAMIISGIVIACYTMLGGFLAASITDLIQSIVMSAALVIVVIFGINAAGGFDVVASTAGEVPGYISMTSITDVITREVSEFSGLSIVSTLAWGLGYFGMPHFLIRFMAIKDSKELKISRRIAIIWVVLAMGVAALIGFVGYTMSVLGEIPLLEDSGSAERVVIHMAELLARNGVVFGLVGGVILAGILASTMSTADSQLLAASSSFSHNILQEVFRIRMSEKTMMIVARISVVGISVVSMFIARDPDSSIFRIVSFAWAGFGAAFGPLMLFSLFWKRVTRPAAILGLISGGVMVFVWKFLIRPLGGAWDIYELLPAFIISAAVIVIVSLATKKPEKEIEDTFESVRAELKTH